MYAPAISRLTSTFDRFVLLTQGTNRAGVCAFVCVRACVRTSKQLNSVSVSVVTLTTKKKVMRR